MDPGPTWCVFSVCSEVQNAGGPGSPAISLNHLLISTCPMIPWVKPLGLVFKDSSSGHQEQHPALEPVQSHTVRSLGLSPYGSRGSSHAWL